MTLAPDTPTILVVDDERCVLRSVSRLLERAGYRVLMASSGEEAVRYVQADSVTAVVCDMRLPGLSGTALFERLQSAAPSLAGRILVTSGDLGQGDAVGFRERTGVPALLKPYAAAELLASLDRLCGQLDRAAS